MPSKREFNAILKRKGGLEFDVTQGVLRLQEVGGGQDARRDVDFRGHTITSAES